MDEKIKAIIGPPGCGKTHALGAIVEHELSEHLTPWGGRIGDGYPVYVCSLTRAAATECAERFRGEGRHGCDTRVKRDAVGTLHSAAYRQLGAPQLVVGKKIKELEDDTGYQFSDARDDDIDDHRPDTPPDSAVDGDALLSRLDWYRHTRTPLPMDSHLARFAEQYSRWKRENEMLDFTDLIEHATTDTHEAPNGARHLIVDEAQDLSRLELDLLKRWALSAERLTICGDPRQALYVWRGAHPEMFADQRLENSTEVLSQSWRVPQAVHTAAEDWARRLSSWAPQPYTPRDEKGDTGQLSGSTWREPERLLDRIDDWLSNGDSVLIQASCGYMLTPMIVTLRRHGYPFANPRRRKRGDWNPLGAGGGTSMRQRSLDLTTPPPDQSWSGTQARRWLEVMRAKGVIRRGMKSKIPSLLHDDTDIVDVINHVMDILEPATFQHVYDMAFSGEELTPLLLWWTSNVESAKQKTANYIAEIVKQRGIQQLEREPKLYVGTIHSFKGFEADHVITFPDLSAAGARQWSAGGVSADECTRLGYVAITRARATSWTTSPVNCQQAIPLWEVL